MAIEQGKYFTKTVANQLIAENEKVHFPSKLKFIQQHKGFRPGKLHLLIGQSGGGKSTITRTLMLDAAAGLKKNKKMLVWLSEETVTDMFTQLAYSGVAEHASVLLDRMDFYSEKDERNVEKDLRQVMLDMKGLYENEKYDILFFDNATTSKLYSGRHPSDQDRTADWIKGLSSKTNTVSILVGHTGANPRGDLLTHNDIRGSKHLVNLCEYIYILQTIEVDSFKHTVLRVDKSRAHEAPDAFFSLSYDRVQKLYTEARSVDFVRFKEIFKGRNKL